MPVSLSVCAFVGVCALCFVLCALCFVFCALCFVLCALYLVRCAISFVFVLCALCLELHVINHSVMYFPISCSLRFSVDELRKGWSTNVKPPAGFPLRFRSRGPPRARAPRRRPPGGSRPTCCGPRGSPPAGSLTSHQSTPLVSSTVTPFVAETPPNSSRKKRYGLARPKLFCH